MAVKCLKHIHSGRRDDTRGHRCTRNAVSGGFCKIHTPEYEAKRDTENAKRYEDKMANSVHRRLQRASKKLREIERLFDIWEESSDVVAKSYAAQAKLVLNGSDNAT